MRLRLLRTTAVGVVAVLGAGCGGAAPSAHPTTTRPSAPGTQRQVAAGRLTFTVPSSWTVGEGVCRCGWGRPDTATLDNGPQGGGVTCNCPSEAEDVPSGLHLYEGQGGLLPGGRATTVHGVKALVGLDSSTATLTATFPDIDQWITIGPAPPPGTDSNRLQQIALEKRILGSVTMVPGDAVSS